MAGAGAPTLVLRGRSRSDRGRAAVGKASREGGCKRREGGRRLSGQCRREAAVTKIFKVVKGQCFPSSILHSFIPSSSSMAAEDLHMT